MELLSAAQALDMVKDAAGQTISSAGAVLRAHQLIRTKVPYAAEDRIFHDDIEAIRQLIRSNSFSAICEGLEF
jgi:histidine ammonia-lyase